MTILVCAEAILYTRRSVAEAIALEAKREFAAKEKTQTMTKTVAKAQPKAGRKAKAA